MSKAPAAVPGADDLASRQFRAFAEVLLRERDALAGIPAEQGQAAAAALSASLCQLIELHSLDAGVAPELQRHGRFLKAALADELMLHFDWPGRVHWPAVRVEGVLFHAGRAGTQVFAGIDQLLAERNPAQRPLGRLYMHLLALGFQGRYRGGDLAPIADYRRELFEFAWQRPPDVIGRVIAPRDPAPTSRIAALAVVVAVALALLALSEALWLWQSAP